MPWPVSQDYNEAVQNPQTSFADAELRAGQVVVNALGMPMPCSGNFADVYQVIGASGKKWAVKCFTRQIPGLRERYREISAYLRNIDLSILVDFTFLDQGIRVRADWYPIVKMQWVDGLALNQVVKSCLDQPQVLDILCQGWLKVAKRLRETNIAHCDLQHGNVLLVPGRKAGSLVVRLVDYDGMWVPALAESKSGEVGHQAYQHPQRLREGIYNRELDRFSHLVIYTAVRAAMVAGRPLWERYDNGDNLLFCQRDFQAPETSSLFQELLQVRDPEVRRLADALSRAARQPLNETPLLEKLLAAGDSVFEPARYPPPVRVTPVAVRSEEVAPPPRPEEANLLAEDSFSYLDQAPPPVRVSRAEATITVPGPLTDDAVEESIFDLVSNTAIARPPETRSTHNWKRNLIVAAGVCVLGLVALIVVAIVIATAHPSAPTAKPPASEAEAEKKPSSNRLADASRADLRSDRETHPVKKDEPSLPPSEKPPKVGPPLPPEVKPPPAPEKKEEPDMPRRYLTEDIYCVTSVVLLPDHRFAFRNSKGGLSFWGRSADSPTSVDLPDPLTGIVFSPRTAKVACGDEKGGIYLFNADAFGKEIREAGLKKAHEKAVDALAFSSDGKWLLSGAADGKVNLWDIGTGASNRTIASQMKRIRAVALSEFGERAYWGGDEGRVHARDVANDRNIDLANGPSDTITSLVLSRDDRFLYCAAKDKSIWQWDLKDSNKAPRREKLGAEATCLAVSPDGRFLLSGEERKINVWDARTGKYLHTFGGKYDLVFSLAFSPDGKQLISGHERGILILWPLSMVEESGKSESK
jgi:WD40 repeat protein